MRRCQVLAITTTTLLLVVAAVASNAAPLLHGDGGGEEQAPPSGPLFDDGDMDHLLRLTAELKARVADDNGRAFDAQSSASGRRQEGDADTCNNVLYPALEQAAKAACGDTYADDLTALAVPSNHSAEAFTAIQQLCSTECQAVYTEHAQRMVDRKCPQSQFLQVGLIHLGMCRRFDGDTCAARSKTFAYKQCIHVHNESECQTSISAGKWCKFTNGACFAEWSQQRLAQYCTPCYHVYTNMFSTWWLLFGNAFLGNYYRRYYNALFNMECSRVGDTYCTALMANTTANPLMPRQINGIHRVNGAFESLSVPMSPASVNASLDAMCAETNGMSCASVYSSAARAWATVEWSNNVPTRIRECGTDATCQLDTAVAYQQAMARVDYMYDPAYVCGRNAAGERCPAVMYDVLRNITCAYQAFTISDHGMTLSWNAAAECDAACGEWLTQSVERLGCCETWRPDIRTALKLDRAPLVMKQVVASDAELLQRAGTEDFFVRYSLVCNSSIGDSYIANAARVNTTRAQACPLPARAVFPFQRALLIRGLTWSRFASDAFLRGHVAAMLRSDLSGFLGVARDRVNGTVVEDAGRPVAGTAGNSSMRFEFVVEAPSANAAVQLSARFDSAVAERQLLLPNLAMYVDNECPTCALGMTIRTGESLYGGPHSHSTCRAPSSAAAASLFPAASSCPAYAACGAALCSCVGSTLTSNATTCMRFARAGLTCSAAGACLSVYMECVHGVTAQRGNATSPCRTLGVSVHMQELATTVSSYPGSTLQQACSYRACSILNASATLARCDLGANDSSVCIPRGATVNRPVNTTNLTVTPVASTLPADFVQALRATIRINGNAFAQLLNDAARRQELLVAVNSDLAGLLQVLAQFVRVLNMYEGSLVIDFAVDGAAGVAPETLLANLQSMSTNPNWLSSIQSVYSTVSNETLTANIVSVATAAPGLVTPSPPPGGISSPSPAAGTTTTMVVIMGTLLGLAVLS